MREGGKKIKKKNIEPIFEKVNEGDQIKKTLDKFLEKLMRATEKTKQNIGGKIFFISRNELVFFGMFLFGNWHIYTMKMDEVMSVIDTG